MPDRRIDRPYAEERIWRPLAERPNCLGQGYAGAVALHQVQLGDQSGYADLILIPRRGAKKLIVVEAKHARDRRSSADVIGQLLKYYAHALDLGAAGLAAYTTCARKARRRRRLSRLLSFKAVLGCASLEEAKEKAVRGAHLRPKDIQLLVALDMDARKFAPRLLKTVRLLRRLHDIPLGIVVVAKGRAAWLCPVSRNRANSAG